MIKDINGNDVPLTPLPDIIQDPLCQYRYKYTSADHCYYILVTYATIDGISRVYWSLYRYDNDDNNDNDNNDKTIVQENIISLSKDFEEMILAEEWIDEGYEVVPCQ